MISNFIHENKSNLGYKSNILIVIATLIYEIKIFFRYLLIKIYNIIWFLIFKDLSNY